MHVHVFSLLNGFLVDCKGIPCQSKHLREKVSSVQACITVQYRFEVLSVIWIVFSQQKMKLGGKSWNSCEEVFRFQTWAVSKIHHPHETNKKHRGREQWCWWNLTFFLAFMFSLPFPSLWCLKLTPCMFSWPSFPYLCTWTMFWAGWKQQVLVTWAVCVGISHPAVHSW